MTSEKPFAMYTRVWWEVARGAFALGLFLRLEWDGRSIVLVLQTPVSEVHLPFELIVPKDVVLTAVPEEGFE